MSQHRGTTKPGQSGNFRLRQHFLETDSCNSFSIQIIQKLAGTGRTDVLRPNSAKYSIDENITKIRKQHEDNWIRVLGTQFPYGMNDRIDSLQNKDLFNCEYAKFISSKNASRKRSWAGGKRQELLQSDIDGIVNELLRHVLEPFHSNVNIHLRKLLFPLNKDILIKLKELYFSVFKQYHNFIIEFYNRIHYNEITSFYHYHILLGLPQLLSV